MSGDGGWDSWGAEGVSAVQSALVVEGAGSSSSSASTAGDHEGGRGGVSDKTHANAKPGSPGTGSANERGIHAGNSAAPPARQYPPTPTQSTVSISRRPYPPENEAGSGSGYNHGVYQRDRKEAISIMGRSSRMPSEVVPVNGHVSSGAPSEVRSHASRAAERDLERERSDRDERPNRGDRGPQLGPRSFIPESRPPLSAVSPTRAGWQVSGPDKPTAPGVENDFGSSAKGGYSASKLSDSQRSGVSRQDEAVALAKSGWETEEETGPSRPDANAGGWGAPVTATSTDYGRPAQPESRHGGRDGREAYGNPAAFQENSQESGGWGKSFSNPSQESAGHGGGWGSSAGGDAGSGYNFGGGMTGGFSTSGGNGGRSCFNCGREDHFSRECPEPRMGGGGGGANMTCFNCNEVGHGRRECPNAPAGGGGGGGMTCYNCNEVGHGSRDCPNPRAERKPNVTIDFPRHIKGGVIGAGCQNLKDISAATGAYVRLVGDDPLARVIAIFKKQHEDMSLVHSALGMLMAKAREMDPDFEPMQGSEAETLWREMRGSTSSQRASSGFADGTGYGPGHSNGTNGASYRGSSRPDGYAANPARDSNDGQSSGWGAPTNSRPEAVATSGWGAPTVSASILAPSAFHQAEIEDASDTFRYPSSRSGSDTGRPTSEGRDSFRQAESMVGIGSRDGWNEGRGHDRGHTVDSGYAGPETTRPRPAQQNANGWFCTSSAAVPSPVKPSFSTEDIRSSSTPTFAQHPTPMNERGVASPGEGSGWQGMSTTPKPQQRHATGERDINSITERMKQASITYDSCGPGMSGWETSGTPPHAANGTSTSKGWGQPADDVPVHRPFHQNEGARRTSDTGSNGISSQARQTSMTGWGEPEDSSHPNRAPDISGWGSLTSSSFDDAPRVPPPSNGYRDAPRSDYQADRYDRPPQTNGYTNGYGDRRPSDASYARSTVSSTGNSGGGGGWGSRSNGGSLPPQNAAFQSAGGGTGYGYSGSFGGSYGGPPPPQGRPGPSGGNEVQPARVRVWGGGAGASSRASAVGSEGGRAPYFGREVPHVPGSGW